MLHSFAHPVAAVTCCCAKFETDQTFGYVQTDVTTLRPFAWGFTFRGSFSNDDDGNENVAKKLNWRPFKLYRVYFDQVNLPNVGEFSWSWILLWLYLRLKRENKIHRRVFTSSIKGRIRRFHVVVVQWTMDIKEMKLKNDARTELLFCSY